MKQPKKVMSFDNLELGFFRFQGKEQIYFAQPHGRETLVHAVINGKIQKRAIIPAFPKFKSQLVEIVPVAEMAQYGMTIEKPADIEAERFWE